MSLRNAILVLLNAEPGSGYDLAQRFRKTLGNFWNASHQQIYQDLKKLADEDLVDFTVEPQPDRPDRRVYTLTGLGRGALREWMRSPVKPPRINDALLVKVYGATPADLPALRAELAQHVVLHRDQLTLYRDRERRYLAADAAQQQQHRLPYLTLRCGIRTEEAWLEWAAELESVLDGMAGDGPARNAQESVE